MKVSSVVLGTPVTAQGGLNIGFWVSVQPQSAQLNISYWWAAANNGKYEVSKKIGERDLCHNILRLPVGGLMLTKFFFILGKQKDFVCLLDLGLLPVWSAGDTA